MNTRPLLIATLLMASCCLASCRHQALPEATAAAKAVYDHYADREGLTVALVGDYRTESGTYTAVMMQADDDSTWQRLLDELDFHYTTATAHAKFDSLPFDPVSVTSLSTGITTMSDSSRTALDSLPDSLKELILNTLGGKQVSGSFTITRSEAYRNDSLVSSTADTTYGSDTAFMSHWKDKTWGDRNSLIHTANANGDRGYIDYCDHDSRTLWLFFFKTQQQMQDILTHVVGTRLPSPE